MTGRSFRSRGEYREVAPPERLVMAFNNLSNPGDPNVEVLTVTFADLGEKTEVVARQSGHLPQGEYPKLVEGYTGFFNRLAEHLGVH